MQPSQKAIDRVRDNFDPHKLTDICERKDFTRYARRYAWKTEPRSEFYDRFYYYENNGSDILAVAHLDHVQKDGSCSIIDTNAGLLAVSGALDDRLGAYVILELLPELGMTFDWLLVTGHERGASTAREFARHKPKKQYNWMIEFDRGGTDVVMYQYERPSLAVLVVDCGAEVAEGTYSDIVELDNLGCSGFNWGVGYRDYHGPRSHAWLEDTFHMVARFEKFYGVNAHHSFKHQAWPHMVARP